MDNTPTDVRYLNIVVSEKGLSEFSNDRRIIFIPKEEVRIIQIGHASGAERPALQILAGLLLLSLGIFGLSIVAHGIREVRWGFIFFGGLGAWLKSRAPMEQKPTL